MTVISRLLRPAPSTPKPSDQKDSGQALHSAQSPDPSELDAGYALYTLAGLVGPVGPDRYASAGGDSQRAAQQRLAQLLDNGALALAELQAHAQHPTALLCGERDGRRTGATSDARS